MNILELSRQAMRGDADAMCRLIRSLADDFYACRPAGLERARADLERALHEYSEQTPARKEIEILWELTHVFLSRIPASLGEFTRLASDATENALLNLMPSHEALRAHEICARLALDESSVQRALHGLEQLGLVASLPGDACALTRDGRQVKRWVTGQRIVARDAEEPAACEVHRLRADDDLRLLDSREACALEAKVEPGAEIWVVGSTTPSLAAFFATVRDNLRRGVQYFYMSPVTEFATLWSKLVASLGADQLRGRLVCIAHAPALLRLNSARIHVLPSAGSIRSLRVCWRAGDTPEPFHQAISTPTALDPTAPLLQSYARAARQLVARSGEMVLDFQQLEAEVGSL